MNDTLDKVRENALRVQIARLLDLFIIHDGDTALELACLTEGVPSEGIYRDAQQDISLAILSLKAAEPR